MGSAHRRRQATPRSHFLSPNPRPPISRTTVLFFSAEPLAFALAIFVFPVPPRPRVPNKTEERSTPKHKTHTRDFSSSMMLQSRQVQAAGAPVRTRAAVPKVPAASAATARRAAAPAARASAVSGGSAFSSGNANRGPSPARFSTGASGPAPTEKTTNPLNIVLCVWRAPLASIVAPFARAERARRLCFLIGERGGSREGATPPKRARSRAAFAAHATTHPLDPRNLTPPRHHPSSSPPQQPNKTTA